LLGSAPLSLSTVGLGSLVYKRSKCAEAMLVGGVDGQLVCDPCVCRLHSLAGVVNKATPAFYAAVVDLVLLVDGCGHVDVDSHGSSCCYSWTVRLHHLAIYTYNYIQSRISMKRDASHTIATGAPVASHHHDNIKMTK
jgi:hypothetical protein